MPHPSNPPDQPGTRQLSSDTELLQELKAKHTQTIRYVSEITHLRFANKTLAEIAKPSYTSRELSELEGFLDQKGTLAIPVKSDFSVMVGGMRQNVSVVAATETDANHGDMSSMLYLRDHVQAASVLMELSLSDPNNYQREGEMGKSLLLSALHLMSTPAQLERFKHIIERGEASQEDWPHISLLFNDMEAKEPNGWRNKQDTFQMLAFLACDALERGYLVVSELTQPHKRFLGYVAPLLQAVRYPKYENSGSWEEVAANRTSVMAIETALLHKIMMLTAKNEELGFLLGGLSTGDLAAMYDNGLHELGRRLPFESPDYPKDSIKYREADAALAYVLMYGIPKLLADEEIPIGPRREIMDEHAIEDLVLQELTSLIDPETGAMRRYDGDSYQRVNFHTSGVQKTIANIKRTVKQEAGSGEIDLDKKQLLRGELTPKGREAAWTHPLGQLSAWAAKRSIQAYKNGQSDDTQRYRMLSIRFLNHALASVTGENDWHAVLDANNRYTVQKASANRLPECYVTYETPDGKTFIVPSPHTPLNWSSAMLKEAVGLLRISTMLQ
jgi:hypothetical protein